MALSNGQDQWPKEDIVMLLDLMKNNLPANDNHTFKTTQSHVDWGKVAFKGYSGERCKLKWLEISSKIRKYRTLTELVLEAKEHVKNSYKSKKLQKHPDMPKQPLTSYLRFFKEKRLEYSQMHPKLNNKELTKVMSEKYKELPEEMKMKYIQDFQKEKQEYRGKMAQFRKNHPELVQNSKTSVVPKRSPNRAPKKFQRKGKEVKSSSENNFSEEIKFHGEPEKPPMNEYQKFHQDMWSSMELQGLPLRERMVEISRRWQHIPKSQREHYRKQAEELQKQYKVDLEHWLKSLSPEEYAAYRERTSGKRKNMNMRGGPDPKIIGTDVQSPSARSLQRELAQNQGPQAPGTESSETNGNCFHSSRGSEEKEEHEENAESCSSSDSSSSDEDDSSSSSSSSGDTSGSDSN
ncbi:Putative upstream-binding factor 1-like protein 1 [Myotis brandtii]|uniref:Putative upstream-binding factor 1-like protein 1 n=1 Tax=Myotis brandtii TaxID=109478 RepID=S7NBL5_MYOBR|nr:PREDICTED: upstream-binding factor 1-like protein 1 [Myotis brandtii]EPQ14431.1 Putative upstream-binding factor 1-like protein 1 [Myotis brandtii]